MPGPQELIVIAVVALLVFGPHRLPEFARNAAKVLARIRAETQKSMGELKRAAELDGVDEDLRDIRRDLRETRDAVTRQITGTDASSPRPARRADDDPPPTDPEAT